MSFPAVGAGGVRRDAHQQQQQQQPVQRSGSQAPGPAPAPSGGAVADGARFETQPAVRRRQRGGRAATDRSVDSAAATAAAAASAAASASAALAYPARAATGGAATAAPSGGSSGTVFGRVRAGAKQSPQVHSGHGFGAGTAATGSSSPSSSPMPMSLLLHSYPLGSVRTLNGRVGKVAWAGTLVSLHGSGGASEKNSAWVALSCYRAHGGARKLPLLDFDTVELVRRREGGGGGGSGGEADVHVVLVPVPAKGASHGGSIAAAQHASASIAAADALRTRAPVSIQVPPPSSSSSSSIAAAAAAASSTSSLDHSGGFPGPHAPEVDAATLLRAQREAAKHLSVGVLDSTVLVRVRVCSERNDATGSDSPNQHAPAQHQHHTHPRSSHLSVPIGQAGQQQHQQPHQQSSQPLLPALSSPRTGVGAPRSPRPSAGAPSSSLASPRRPAEHGGPQPQPPSPRNNGAAAAAAPAPVPGSARKRERRLHAHAPAHDAPLSRAREARSEEEHTAQQRPSDEQKESSSYSHAAVAVAPAADAATVITPHKSHQIPAALSDATGDASSAPSSASDPDTSAFPSSTATMLSLAFVQPSLPPTPAPLVVESEAHLSVLARQLHLTGPFALVDALALTVPPRVASQGLYPLARYLSTSFPRVLRGDEARARAILRWVAAHVQLESSPLADAINPQQEKERMNRRDQLKRGRTLAAADGANADVGAAAAGAVAGAQQPPAPDGRPSAPTSPALPANRGLQAAASASADPASSSSSSAGAAKPPGALSSNDPSNSALALVTAPSAASLSERARMLAVRELGMGPSARGPGLRPRPHASTAHAAPGRHPRGHGGRHSNGGGGGSNGGAFFSSFGLGLHTGEGAGYSSEEDQHSLGEHSIGHTSVDARTTGTSATPTSSSLSQAPDPASAPDSNLDPSAPLTAASVLQSRRSSALGFALLFQALAAIAGLESVVVRGLRKFGPEYRKRPSAASATTTAGSSTGSLSRMPSTTSGNDHSLPVVAHSAWNLVRIEGRWATIDCCGCSGFWDVNAPSPSSWSPPGRGGGRGEGSGEGAFVRSFSPAYFAPPPELFILTHFPLSLCADGEEAETTDLLSRRTSAVEGGAGAEGEGTVGSNVESKQAAAAAIAAAASSFGVIVAHKDPLVMSVPELSQSPRSLQLLHPATSRRTWHASVSCSRLYAVYEVSTLETEYHILYGIDALGGGVSGATFRIEIEGPVWMECAVEMVRMGDAAAAGASPSSGMALTRMRSRAMKKAAAATAAAAVTTSAKAQRRSNGGVSSTLSPRTAGRQLQQQQQQQQQEQSQRGGDAGADEADQCDLSTCWAVQKAVGTRLEIRQPTAASVALSGPSSLSSTSAALGASASASAAGFSTSVPLVASMPVLQRQKRVVHRTRTKVHLVFPHAGHYRIIIHAQTKVTSELRPASPDHADVTQGGDGAGADDAGANGPAAVWEPLMEYAVTVQQGVADLPRRKAPLKVVVPPAAAAQPTAAAQIAAPSTASAPPVADGSPASPAAPSSSSSSSSPPGAAPTDAAGTASSSASASATVVPAAPTSPLPSTPAAPLLRHVWVGFLQAHQPTFSLLCPARTLAAQIVALRPWSGVWELSLPVSLQYLAPSAVSEMVLVSDGRWSAMNEGPQGFVDTKYATSQSQLLRLCVHQAAALDLAGGAMAAAGGGRGGGGGGSGVGGSGSSGDLALRSHGSHRHLYTLDWALLSLPELLVYFKSGGRYHLLSSFRPRDARNYLRDRGGGRAGAGRNRRRGGERSFDFEADAPQGEDNTGDASAGANGANGESNPPLESRFWIALSGAAFTVQLHVQHESIVVNRRKVSMLVDCLRGVLVRARLVEEWWDDWASGSHAAGVTRPPTLLTLAQLQAEQQDEHADTDGGNSDGGVRVEQVEDLPPPTHPSLAKALSQMPRSRAALQSQSQSRAAGRGRTGASGTAAGGASTASSTTQDSAQPASDDATPARNPLHQRLRITAALPPPDAVIHSRTTRRFTLLLYVSPPAEGAEHLTPSSPSSDRLLELAMSYRLQVVDEPTRSFPLPSFATR